MSDSHYVPLALSVALIFPLVFAAAAAFAEETPPLSAAAAELPAGTTVAVLTLDNGGVVQIQILEDEAPATAANFIKLVSEKFYDGIPFHRVVPDFVAQAGDPTLVGRPAPDITLVTEQGKRPFTRGVVSMARLFDPATKEYGATSPTQFFILKKDSPHLNPNFCVFGLVVSGMDVVDEIKQGDVIKSIRLIKIGE